MHRVETEAVDDENDRSMLPMPEGGPSAARPVRVPDDADMARIREMAQYPHGRPEGTVMPQTPISQGSKPVTREVCELRRVPIEDSLEEFKGWAKGHDQKHEKAQIEQRSQNRWAIGILIPVAMAVMTLVLEMLAGKF